MAENFYNKYQFTYIYTHFNLDLDLFNFMNNLDY